MEDDLRPRILDGCDEGGKVGEVSAHLDHGGWSLTRFGIRDEAPHLGLGSDVSDVLREIVADKAGDAGDQDSHGCSKYRASASCHRGIGRSRMVSTRVVSRIE